MAERDSIVEISERIAGRYRVEELIGRGGMGTVYRVHDERSGKQLALKRGRRIDRRGRQRPKQLIAGNRRQRNSGASERCGVDYSSSASSHGSLAAARTGQRGCRHVMG